MKNTNTREALERIKVQVLANLALLPPVPSAQMAPRPPKTELVRSLCVDIAWLTVHAAMIGCQAGSDGPGVQFAADGRAVVSASSPPPSSHPPFPPQPDMPEVDMDARGGGQAYDDKRVAHDNDYASGQYCALYLDGGAWKERLQSTSRHSGCCSQQGNMQHMYHVPINLIPPATPPAKPGDEDVQPARDLPVRPKEVRGL